MLIQKNAVFHTVTVLNPQVMEVHLSFSLLQSLTWRLLVVAVRVCVCVCVCVRTSTLESACFKLHEGFLWMILGHFSGWMQWLLCRTRPAGHWQPGTQGLKQWLSITPSGTSTLKQVTGHGGPHSSNTKPLSTGQPTAVEDSNREETMRGTENIVSTAASRMWPSVDLWWWPGITGRRLTTIRPPIALAFHLRVNLSACCSEH